MHTELPRELQMVQGQHHQMQHHQMPSFEHNRIPTSRLQRYEGQAQFHKNRHTWHGDMSKYSRQKAVYYHALGSTTANPFKKWMYMSRASKHQRAAQDHFRKHKLHELKSRLHSEKGVAAFHYTKPQRYRYV